MKESNSTDKQGRNQGENNPAINPAKIDFSTFVLSLFTAAQLQLGEIPNPYTQAFEQDLTLASETIDIIALLKEKTSGNLTEEEAKLFEGLLYSLRTSYLNKTKK